MPHSDSEAKSLKEICDDLSAQSDQVDGESVTVQTVLDAFSGRIFGPLLLVPAIIVIIPIFGGIPTVPTIMGGLVILVAGQAALGFKHPWVPKLISNRGISKEKFQKGMDRFTPWAKRIDRFIHPRLRIFVTGVMQRGIAFICVLLACSLPPLELLPFAAALPGAGIFCLGLAMTAEDGLLGLMGMLSAAGVMGLLVWMLF